MENRIITSEAGVIVDEHSLKDASAILALLHGKSDSICRIFRKEILVDKSDLSALNTQLLTKLSLHNISDVTISIDITFSNKRILTFKSWNDFAMHDFSAETAATKCIFIQWDFFAKFATYQFPQRHTVSIRISSTPKPSDFFRALISGGFDEAEDFEMQSCTMMCKVDFVNNTLAEELIHVSEQWYEGAEKACEQRGKFKCFLFEHRSILASVFEWMLLLTFAWIFAILWKLGIKFQWFSANEQTICYCLFAALPVAKLCKSIAHYCSKSLYDKFGNLLDIHVFSISKGDTKLQARIEKASKCAKEVVLFIANTLISIVLSYIFYIID